MVSPVLSQSLDTHDRPAYPQRIDAPAEGEKFNKRSADHRPRGGTIEKGEKNGRRVDWVQFPVVLERDGRAKMED